MKKFLTVAFIAMLMVCICIGGALIAQAEDLDHEHNHEEIWVQVVEGGVKKHQKVCETCGAELGDLQACEAEDPANVSCLDLINCVTCKKVYYEDQYGKKHSTQKVLATPYEVAEVADNTQKHGYKCADCDVIIELADHVPGAAANCQRGTVCSVCTMAYGEVDPNNHVWGSYVKVSDTQHKEVCPCGAEKDPVNHSGGTATCLAKAICTDCKEAYGDLGDHAYDNACDADCNLCGATRTPAAHAFGDWQVTKEATESEEGAKKRVCSVCGKEETEKIAKLTDPNNDGKEPGDDDSSSNTAVIIIIVVVAVVVVAGAVAAFIIVKKKKKDDKAS